MSGYGTFHFGNAADFPNGLGLQDDAIRIENSFRLVQDAE